MNDHKHNFPEEEWPFEEAINHVSYTTKFVAHENFPILLITHDEDGDWQFLCGTTNEQEDAVVACLGCLYERHPFIKEFANLPKGYLAWRDSEEEAWQIEEQEQEPESE